MSWRRYASGTLAIMHFIPLCLLLAMIGILVNARPCQAQEPAQEEITSNETQPNFSLHVQHNEVLVRVVVRDANGNVVTELKKDDFQIFDDGKPQAITHFSLETPGVNVAAKTPSNPGPPQAGEEPTPTIILPRRFMALFFDDIHVESGDLVRTREAADQYLATHMKPGDRIALFTASGHYQVDFTDDRAKLHDALMQLLPRPISPSESAQCPPIVPYQAYKIFMQKDADAIELAQLEALHECCGMRNCPQTDINYIDRQAQQLLRDTEMDSLYVMQGLERVCRRMASLQGQRTIVLVSPGFLVLTQTSILGQVLDQALRTNVVINTLDARGLYVNTMGGDASERGMVLAEATRLVMYKSQLQYESKSMNGDVLASVASGTGGTVFRNSNDYAGGFERVGAFPAAYYQFAFAPPDMKADGREHNLKVTLASNPGQYTLQARKSYFAPKKNEDLTALATERMEQIVFSDDQPQTIPLRVHTQFFKTAVGDANLSVIARMDISQVHFSKSEGKNLDTLTVITVVFDAAGNYVDGKQRVLDLKLQDATLARLKQLGLNFKTSFSVKPGTYLVREVVQDSESSLISALSSLVEIP